MISTTKCSQTYRINDFGYKYATYTEKELAPFNSTKKKKKHINAKMFKLLN